MSEFTVYLMIVLSNISKLAIVLSIFAVVFAVLLCAVPYIEDDIDTIDWKMVILSVRIAVAFIILSIIIPSKQDLIAIYVIPKIVNNEILVELPDYIKTFLEAQK